MIRKMPTHCGDDTCSSCVVAGDFIFLAHHGGGLDREDIIHQTRATIESIAHCHKICRFILSVPNGWDCLQAPKRHAISTA